MHAFFKFQLRGKRMELYFQLLFSPQSGTMTILVTAPEMQEEFLFSGNKTIYASD